MSKQVRITCDHPAGCVRFIELPYSDWPTDADRHRWLTGHRWNGREFVAHDLCPEHKHDRPANGHYRDRAGEKPRASRTS